MRTVKRQILQPNTKKCTLLNELRHAYTNEKQYWLRRLQAWDLQALLGRSRTIRDKMIQQEYKSLHGLQARH
jgi:hypothetical protein